MKKFLFLFLFFTNLNSITNEDILNDLNKAFNNLEEFKTSRYFSDWFKDVFSENLIETLGFKLISEMAFWNVIDENKKLFIKFDKKIITNNFEILFLVELVNLLNDRIDLKEKYEIIADTLRQNIEDKILEYPDSYLFEAFNLVVKKVSGVLKKKQA